MIEKLKVNMYILILMEHYQNTDITINYTVENVLNLDVNHLKIYYLMIYTIELDLLKQCKKL